MRKDVQLHISGEYFSASLTMGMVHLHNSPTLKRFLDQYKLDGALQLSTAVLEAYRTHFSHHLGVAADSMAVEILGHLYFDNFFDALGERIPGRIMERLNARIDAHCEEVNIGETSKDTNRFFWDLVTPFVKRYFY